LVNNLLTQSIYKFVGINYYPEAYQHLRDQCSFPGPPKEDAPRFSEADGAKVGVEDEEYARMMSRLDELEKEELEAECGNGNNEDNAKLASKDEEYSRIMSRLDELEKEEPEAEHDNENDEEDKIIADFDQLWNQRSLDNNLRYSEVMCWII
jgi:unconventional prefoldin RPB5 interactor 1